MIYKYVFLSRPVYLTAPYTIPVECLKGSSNSTFQNQIFNTSSKWCFYSTVPVSLSPTKNQGIISKTSFTSSTIFIYHPIDFISQIFPRSVHSLHLNHYDASWPTFISCFCSSNSYLTDLPGPTANRPSPHSLHCSQNDCSKIQTWLCHTSWLTLWLSSDLWVEQENVIWPKSSTRSGLCLHYPSSHTLLISFLPP